MQASGLAQALDTAVEVAPCVAALGALVRCGDEKELNDLTFAAVHAALS